MSTRAGGMSARDTTDTDTTPTGEGARGGFVVCQRVGADRCPRWKREPTVNRAVRVERGSGREKSAGPAGGVFGNLDQG